MKLLLGIPTFRRPAELGALLRSIAAQRLPPTVAIEVFVADNDPRDRAGVAVVEAVAALYRWPLSAALVEQPGIDATRNRILDEARARRADLSR